MKQKRKEELLYQFPKLPNDLYEQMEGKNLADNFCVFLSDGHELFVRCYHRYCSGEIIERQRYVFAKDGAVRYIFNEYDTEHKGGWRIASKFKEPRFASIYYPYSFNNSYHILNFDAFKKSDMKYSQLDRFYCNCPLSYLRLYCRYPNLEYIVKAGYSHLISEEQDGFWGTLLTVKISSEVNLKSNNLLKMLHLNRTEFKLLKGQEKLYECYLYNREQFPRYKPEELIEISKTYRFELGTLSQHINRSGLTAKRLSRYLLENDIRVNDYTDYLDQCDKLKYNLRDTAISMPRDFYTMHARLSALVETKANEKTVKAFNANYEWRKQLEFEKGDMFLRQPETVTEIVIEGKILCHCVGGYAERHANGKTNILFIRKKSEPDRPYYTVEVDNDYNIVQCRGYRNDRQGEKPQEVKDFEEQYSKYLEELKNVRNRVKIKSA